MAARFERETDDPEKMIGYQAQCDDCEYASILHNHQEHAVEDAAIHAKYYYHHIYVWQVRL